MHTQLPHQVFAMLAHGAVAQSERLRDLFARETLLQPAQYLDLARGQPGGGQFLVGK